VSEKAKQQKEKGKIERIHKENKTIKPKRGNLRLGRL
jgi:hypothetical protein